MKPHMHMNQATPKLLGKDADAYVCLGSNNVEQASKDMFFWSFPPAPYNNSKQDSKWIDMSAGGLRIHGVPQSP
eukprot:1161782-Pelagomonas_calceolata.AAC.11